VPKNKTTDAAKLLLRLPKPLHKRLQQQARRNNTSVNTEILNQLSGYRNAVCHAKSAEFDAHVLKTLLDALRDTWAAPMPTTEAELNRRNSALDTIRQIIGYMHTHADDVPPSPDKIPEIQEMREIQKIRLRNFVLDLIREKPPVGLLREKLPEEE
jgi:hypothetical protein